MEASSLLPLGNGHQFMVAVGFILLSVSIAALLTRYRVSGHFEWIMASALVALGGIPALWLAADWAGWLTATLFVLQRWCGTYAMFRDFRHAWSCELSPHRGGVALPAVSRDGRKRGLLAGIQAASARPSFTRAKISAWLRQGGRDCSRCSGSGLEPTD